MEWYTAAMVEAVEGSAGRVCVHVCGRGGGWQREGITEWGERVGGGD